MTTTQCGQCVHFRAKTPNDTMKQTENDIQYDSWCNKLGIAVSKLTLRCGGDDFKPGLGFAHIAKNDSVRN